MVRETIALVRRQVRLEAILYVSLVSAGAATRVTVLSNALSALDLTIS